MEWPDELVSDIARRKVVIFIGAGVSMNSSGNHNKKPPSWRELLLKFLEKVDNPKRHIKSLVNNGDFLTACEILKKRLGKGTFNSILNEEFSEPNYNPSKIHELIFKLDSRIVITPNYDKIYDIFATNTDGTIKIKKFNDTDLAETIRRPQRIILKIHGSIDNTDDLIFTRSEYAKAKSKQHNFYKVLESLILTHTFLFLGCSLNDPDIKLLLEDYNFRFESGKKHYLVQANSNLNIDNINAVENSLGIKLLTYRNKDKKHAELQEHLDDLTKKVEEEREHIAITKEW